MTVTACPVFFQLLHTNTLDLKEYFTAYDGLMGIFRYYPVLIRDILDFGKVFREVFPLFPHCQIPGISAVA